MTDPIIVNETNHSDDTSETKKSLKPLGRKILFWGAAVLGTIAATALLANAIRRPEDEEYDVYVLEPSEQDSADQIPVD